MKPTQAIAAVTSQFIKAEVPDFNVGDTVRVSVRVVEGTRERIQVFEGVVMRRRKGGINEAFTVRRVASHGIGVERTFLVHSPRIDKIEVVRRGVVRRAQLYYLRGLTGKAARIKERRSRPGVDDKKNRAAAAAAALAAANAAAVVPVSEDVADDTADDDTLTTTDADVETDALADTTDTTDTGDTAESAEDTETGA